MVAGAADGSNGKVSGRPADVAVTAQLAHGSQRTNKFIATNSDLSLSTLDQSIVGALSKAATKLVLHPFDTWKSRCQARRFSSMVEFQGLWTPAGIYRGLAPKLLLYAPYQAVYMATYVQARGFLINAPLPFGGTSGLSFVLAGVIAEITASLVRLPMEVSKLRLQLGIYSNSRKALQHFLRQPWGVYSNFIPQTLMHDCAYSAVAWLIFEKSRQWLFALRGSSELPPHENLILGGITGTTSAFITTPFDVLKTRIVGRSPGSSQASGVFHVARDILRHEGARAFWRGALLRVLHIAPSHGLYMFLFETGKSQLCAWRCGHLDS